MSDDKPYGYAFVILEKCDILPLAFSLMLKAKQELVKSQKICLLGI
jgi:hypothetical protein